VWIDLLNPLDFCRARFSSSEPLASLKVRARDSAFNALGGVQKWDLILITHIYIVSLYENRNEFGAAMSTPIF
jgi:hypothetical protein